jgi:hypothetical protein
MLSAYTFYPIPVLLLKDGFRLRITSKIRDAEITDSRNQTVLN